MHLQAGMKKRRKKCLQTKLVVEVFGGLVVLVGGQRRGEWASESARSSARRAWAGQGKK